MLLIQGKLYPSDALEQLLPMIQKNLLAAKSRPLLDLEVVFQACNTIADKIVLGEYDELLLPYFTKQEMELAALRLTRESLERRLQEELGAKIGVSLSYSHDATPEEQETDHYHKMIQPLGVLFHIAAGNMEVIPAFSAIEGLLTGNINLLKLPHQDYGLTIALLQELIKEAPELADYLYVFDTPSYDQAMLQTLASYADGIVVWGSDETVHTVRTMASPGTRLIEWGHKLSFAYIQPQEATDEQLQGLAIHIAKTNQLLCSSCQGIYLDTDNPKVVTSFSKRFLSILDQEMERNKKKSSGSNQKDNQNAMNQSHEELSRSAKISLLSYTDKLAAVTKNKEYQCYRSPNASVYTMNDTKLELSYTHGNVWVKALPKNQIVTCLAQYHDHLQTAALICKKDQRQEIAMSLLRAGVTKITPYDQMSRFINGETHDGEYPLRRYTRIVEL